MVRAIQAFWVNHLLSYQGQAGEKKYECMPMGEVCPQAVGHACNQIDQKHAGIDITLRWL
jgi:hypothetical protein